MRLLVSAAAVVALTVAACALSDRGGPAPAPVPGVAPPPAAPPLHTATLPAPAGAALRLFVDPQQLTGWIAGSESYAGRTARVDLDGARRELPIGPDNLFSMPYAVTHPTEIVVRVGTLEQRAVLEPLAKLEPTVLFVVDRSAYRPGQKLAFAGFLRRMDASGAFAPIPSARVEVRVTSAARNLVAAKLALTSDAAGRIAGEYTFTPADPIDDYTLSIAGHRGTARVTLAEFRKAKVKLGVDLAIRAREATLTLTALDFRDRPVAAGTADYVVQVIRDDGAGEPPVPAAADFAYGTPRRILDPDAAIAHAAAPGVAAAAVGDRVVYQIRESMMLGPTGTDSKPLRLSSEWLRGRHRIAVDATIVDGNGREQRAIRTFPLARRDLRIELATAHDLVGAGEPFDVAVRVLDEHGRPRPAGAMLIATRVPPPAPSYLFGSYGEHGDLGSVSMGRLPGPACQYTGSGCFGRWRSAPVLADPAPAPAPIAAAVAAGSGTGRLVLDEPGAYRITAVVRMADGADVWSELGVAVRERAELPPLTLSLDRDEARQGETVTARLAARYRDARALVIARDATGIVLRRTVALANGAAAVPLALPMQLGEGAAVEAYLLGEGGAIAGAQRALHVLPAQRTLAVSVDARPSYAPGDTVELAIDAHHAGAVDLVVSVFDEGVLGIAPDRAPDPAAFYHGDRRLRGRAAIELIAARLGDLTVEEVVAKAKKRLADEATAAKRPAAPPPPPDDGAGLAIDDALLVAPVPPELMMAHVVVQAFDRHGSGGTIDQGVIVALLRLAGIRAAGITHGYAQWRAVPSDVHRVRLRRMRVAELLARETDLAYESVADAVIVGSPGAVADAALATGAALAGAATGNASFSVAPVTPPPAPLSPDDAAAPGVIRRDFSDSAYWSGHLRSGPDGKARVRFKLPDSITNWRVAVTAVGTDRAGRGTAQLRTTRDVMIWPLLPRQLVQGDTATIAGTIHNLTAAEREIAVSLRAHNARVVSPADVTVRVPAGSSASVEWTVRAGEPGQVAFTMIAASGADADASEKHLPVVAASADQLATASGFADRPLVIELPAGVDPRTARLELELAPTLAADAARSLDYLVEYPYGCAEQTMSRFVPAIRVAGVLANLGLRDSGLAQRLPGVVAGGLKRLAELQQPDGGWGWQIGGQTHEMMTPYVVWGLLEAERAGHALPDPGMVARGLARIRTFVDAADSDISLSDRTYLLYVLGARDRLPDVHWTFLSLERPNMSDYALALTLELAVRRGDRMQADRIAADLRARAQHGSGGVSWRTGGFSRWSDDRLEVTAAVLKALVAYAPADPLIPGALAYFANHKQGEHWGSTKNTAMILYAITELLAAQRGGGGATSIDYTVDGGAPVRVAFADGLVRRITLPAPSGHRTTIAFPTPRPGVLARVVLRYRRAARDLPPAVQGLEVARELRELRPDGTTRTLRPGDRVQRGAYVESIVRVRHAANAPMRYLLVEDPKPAGAETLPADDRRYPRPARGWLREERERHVAYHVEQTGSALEVRSVMHLEMPGELALPPAHAELMYQPATRGHAGGVTIRVD